jgi:hypothetical protein
MSSSSNRTQVNGYTAVSESDSDSDGSEAHETDYHDTSSLRPHHEPSDDQARRRSFMEEDEDLLQIDTSIKDDKKDGPVTWTSLPHKRQLAILVAARLSEPLVQSSLRVCHSNSPDDLKRHTNSSSHIYSTS